MLVFFDTGSGQVILDSTRCSAPACLKHHQYSPDRSGANFVNANGQAVEPGTEGDLATIGLDSSDTEPGIVQGRFVRDLVCLGTERSMGSRMDACAEVIVVAATNMTNQPFLDAPFDGIVGLGLEGLSVNSDYNFFGQLSSIEGLQPQFALFVPNQAEGGRAEISFGGYRPERLAGPLQWVPVAEPEAGFWQVAVQLVRIGNRELNICKDGACRGMVDSSSSHLGVPEEIGAELQEAMGLARGDCSTGPELQLVLEGGVTLTLTVREYADAAAGGDCRPLLHPLRASETAGARHVGEQDRRDGTQLTRTFILGEPVLRRYYAVFDWSAKRLGFGLAATGLLAATNQPAANKRADDMPEHTEEFILMQTREHRHAPREFEEEL